MGVVSNAVDRGIAVGGMYVHMMKQLLVGFCTREPVNYASFPLYNSIQILHSELLITTCF